MKNILLTGRGTALETGPHERRDKSRKDSIARESISPYPLHLPSPKPPAQNNSVG